MRNILKIKPLSENVLNMYNEFEKKYHNDAGCDLFIPEDIVIKPNEKFAIDHQIQCETIEIVPDFSFRFTPKESNISYFLIPRSSIINKTLLMVNSIGIIDAQYRGNIIGVVYNYGKENVELKKGERLFQIIMPNLSYFEIQLVNDLSETERGEKGFGSTG